jgi:hypothetical protein
VISVGGVDVSGLVAPYRTSDVPVVTPGVSHGGGGPVPARGVPPRPGTVDRAGAAAGRSAPGITADALVMATGSGAEPDAAGRRVLAEAAEPLTVAELAARLGVDAARARTVVGELWEAGQLAVTTSPAAAREVHLLRRVLVGLRAY